MPDGYEVRTVGLLGSARAFPADGRDVDRIARRESRRPSIARASVWFAGNWIVTYENGRRKYGASDREDL